MANVDPGGPGTLMHGDLVATRFGLLWVDRTLEAPDGQVVGYVGLELPGIVREIHEVQFETADVACLYRPTWRRQ